MMSQTGARRGWVDAREMAVHEQVRRRRRERCEELHDGTSELGTAHTATTPVAPRLRMVPRTAADAMRSAPLDTDAT